MEKRKPTFERWDLRYGHFSYNDIPLIMQTDDTISVSVYGFLVRREHKNPDKYIVVISKEMELHKESIKKWTNDMELDIVYSMDSEELSVFFDQMINAMKEMLPSANGNMITNCIKEAYKFISTTAFIPLTKAPIPSGEIELDEESATNLFKLLEEHEAMPDSDVEEFEWGVRRKIDRDQFYNVYAPFVRLEEEDDILFNIYKNHDCIMIEFSTHGVYINTKIDDDKDISVAVAVFDYDEETAEGRTIAEWQGLLDVFREDFMINAAFVISYDKFKNEVLPKLANGYFLEGYGETCDNLLELPNIIEHHVPLITSRWRVK